MIGSRLRILLAGTALIALASATGCHQLRFPEQPAPESALPAEAPAAPNWAKLAGQGRSALRAGDLAASQEAYLASLAATSHFGHSDIRVTTSLDNLARLATRFQKRDAFDQASTLVEKLAENAEAGRLAEFESGAPPMIEQARQLSQTDQFEAAIRLNRLALTLLGVDQHDNVSLRLTAQWNLIDAYLGSGQISKADAMIGSLREDLNQRFGQDSPQALGLWIETGRARVANGNFSEAETAYQTVIDSSHSLKEQKIEALELYGELLRSTDRTAEADALAQELESLRAPTSSEGKGQAGGETPVS